MKQVNIQIPLRMLGLLLGLFLSVGAFAQIEVKGHVKDATGEPIIGATVRVDGTQTATVSDFDGNFVLKANEGANITISYVGYQNQTVKAAPNLVVTLQDDAQVLENIVVIGYGRAKKNDLTGSVTAIKPDDMSKGITNNATDMLVGKVHRWWYTGCWCPDTYSWWFVTERLQRSSLCHRRSDYRRQHCYRYVEHPGYDQPERY